MKYAFAALTQNEYGGLTIHCREEELIKVVSESGEMITKCPFTSGDDFVKSLNIQEFLDIETCIILLATMACTCYLLAFLMLKKLTTKKD